MLNTSQLVIEERKKKSVFCRHPTYSTCAVSERSITFSFSFEILQQARTFLSSVKISKRKESVENDSMLYFLILSQKPQGKLSFGAPIQSSFLSQAKTHRCWSDHIFISLTLLDVIILTFFLKVILLVLLASLWFLFRFLFRPIKSIESSILCRASDNSKTGMGALGKKSLALYGFFSYNESKGLPKHRQKRYTGKAPIRWYRKCLLGTYNSLLSRHHKDNNTP